MVSIRRADPRCRSDMSNGVADPCWAIPRWRGSCCGWCSCPCGRSTTQPLKKG